MALLSRTSIRGRTLVTMLLLAGSAMVLAAAVFFSFIVRNAVGFARQELGSLGQVLAYNAAPTVAFEDPEGARKLLEGLRQRTDITRAFVFRANGSALAGYDSEPGRPPLPVPAVQDEGVAWTGSGLRIVTPILTEGGHQAGRLYLESNLQTFRRQLRWAAGALLLALLCLGGIVLLLAIRLQRFLTDPVLELAGLASTVSGTQDYTLRAKVHGISELDFLAQAFNTMLAKIQAQDGILADQLGQLAKELQERKQVEAALRDSERHFRSFYESTTDVMYWVGADPAGRLWVEGINPATEALIGRRNAEVVGRVLEQSDPREVVSSLMIAKLSQCRAGRQPISYEESLNLGAGATHFHINLVPFLDDDGEVHRIFATARDITQLRTAEAAFRQAQKLESLGLLAGGIAHDFNNLLTAVLGNLALADSHLPGESAARPYLGKLEKTVLRAAELTRQMLAYAGRGRFQVECIDLNQAVREISHLLAVSISKTVDLDCRFQEPIPCISADVAQIQQVIMNLVTNASDAIGAAQGRILMNTGVAQFDAADLAAGFPGQPMAPGQYVLLEVTDTGCGMSQETLQKIFDPFFTTKPKGRGLGLSAMIGILRGHQAGIQIRSREGAGSNFRLFFPACADSRKPAAPAGAAEPEPLAGRVLLVDDEEELREAMAEGLAGAGLEVVQARDGQEGLELFRRDPAGFRLVVMDLTMPRMDGKSAFHEMGQLNPAIPVILCSGYDPGESAAFFESHAVAGFLQKPFRLEQLVRTIRQVLGA